MTHFLLKNKKKLLGIAAFAIVCAILIFANLFAGLIVQTDGESEKISSPSFELHLLSLSKSQVKNEALSHAADFQVMGAGGYVWENGGYYHIISSAYLNKSDAELVQNSIKLNQNIDSEILSISFSEYSIFGSFDNDETKALSTLLSSPLAFYNSIYDNAISLDTAVFNETTAKLNANSALNNYAKAIADFGTLFPKVLPDNLSPVYELSLDCYEVAQSLSLGNKQNESQTYSSCLKYHYLKLLRIFYDFVNA